MNAIRRLTQIGIFQVVLAGPALLGYPRDAAAVDGGMGIDYLSGPGGQETKDALGYVSMSAGRGDLTLIGARFDNSVVGPGSVGAVGVEALVAGSTHLRAAGSRTIGDDSYRAWRLQAGPRFDIGAGRTLGVSYIHVEDNLSTLSNGVLTELGWPLSPKLAGGVGASLVSIEGGKTGALGSASLTWGPTPRIQVLGEMSLGQNAVGYSQGVPSSQGGLLGRLPIVGNGSAGTTQPGPATVEYGTLASGLVGLRFLFP